MSSNLLPKGGLPRAALRFGVSAFVLAIAFVIAARAETYHVRVEDDQFVPDGITVAPGDTVVWTNYGSDHTVIADDGSFSSTTQTGVSIPFGQSFSHTFTAVGRYGYYCQLHGSPGGVDMSGYVRVADPGDNLPPAQPVNTAPASGAVGVSVSPTLTVSAFSDPNEGDLHTVSQWIVRLTPSGEVFLDTGETATHRVSLVVAGLSPNTSYSWQVRHKDDRGAWSEYSAATTFTTIAGPSGNGTGLLATYGAYNLRRNAFAAKITHVDPAVDFNWGIKRANPKTPSDHFFARWEGTILPEFSESYRFRLRADGGVRLWVNGTLIIDDWVNWKFAIHRNGVAPLQAGVPAAIKLEYYDTTGAASCSLRWSSVSRSLEVIPQTRLFPPVQP